jgi:hypothetical protein
MSVYKEWVQEAEQAILTVTRLNYGCNNLGNANVPDSNKLKVDNLEKCFFFSEMMEYASLTAEGSVVICRDDGPGADGFG